MYPKSFSILNFDMHAPNALPPLEHSSLTLALKSRCSSKIKPKYLYFCTISTVILKSEWKICN